MTQSSQDHLLPRLPAGQGWQPVSHGESGDRVYRRSDSAAYAKIAIGAGATALEGERRRLEWVAPFGLGTAPVLDWIVKDDAACLVTGTVPGIPAVDLPADRLLQAWPSIIRRLNALHGLPAAECPFDRGLAVMVPRAEDVVARGAVNPDFLSEAARTVPPTILLDRLLAQLPGRQVQEAADRVVCHGDACLPNIMVDPDTLACTGLIDLGRLGTADRYVDLSLLLANSGESWTSQGQAQAARDQLFAILDLPLDQGRLDFYLGLDPLTWG